MPTKIIPRSIKIISGGPFQKPRWPVDPVFRSPNHPNAIKLKKKYHLEEIAGIGDSFDRARRLMHWIQPRMAYGSKNEGQMDALDILPRCEKGGSFNCDYYAQVLIQNCLALGIPARRNGVKRVESSYNNNSNSYYTGHVVCEVFCQEMNKWVLFDPNINSFYTIKGKPASGVEIHRKWHRNKGKGLKRVPDNPKFTYPQTKRWNDFFKYDVKDFYHFFITSTSNGFDTHENLKPNVWNWYCGELPPILMCGKSGLELSNHQFIENESDFNWSLNQTYLQVRMAGEKPTNRVEFVLDHSMPFFKRFEIRIGNGAFRIIKGNRKTLFLGSGRTTIRARCIDLCNKPGFEATAVIRISSN